MTGAPEADWIAIDIVAEIYHVEVEWLLQVEDLGLLRTMRPDTGGLLLAASDLDRVAAAVRWHRHLGLDLEQVALMLLAYAGGLPPR